MAVILSETQNIEERIELYAPDIRIQGNPVDKPAGSIQLELHKLEYRNGEFVRMDPLGIVGETVGEFAAREFEVNGKTITGLDVVTVVEAYTAMMYQERIAGAVEESDPA
ncbi:hypothetical protein [Stenotrophomonas nitritireducens]|uniref:Uncharacterized protein n=1 Tax=Stenotrophomonas nitritireducens TaxID=83617 RepID=A0ABR5NFG8_9GAMM|nr:hypothetical protein [Stenotrophomonas nitritireducens]KRG53618.1 hypothetical protein ABB22_17415 [Stenotrophomonas nitritireducens]